MYIYHNFFIHSSVNGHRHCFPVLAIVNGAAMNSGIHVSFSVIVFALPGASLGKTAEPRASNPL